MWFPLYIYSKNIGMLCPSHHIAVKQTLLADDSPAATWPHWGHANCGSAKMLAWNKKEKIETKY